MILFVFYVFTGVVVAPTPTVEILNFMPLRTFKQEFILKNGVASGKWGCFVDRAGILGYNI